APVGETHPRSVRVMAPAPDSTQKVLGVGHREVVDVRSGQALLDGRDLGPDEIALTPRVQGLDRPAIPVSDVEIARLAHGQPIEREAALAVLAGERRLVSTKRGHDPEAQEDQREVLGPPLAGGIEAQLTVQLLPAVRTAPFPIPLQDPLEAAAGRRASTTRGDAT